MPETSGAEADDQMREAQAYNHSIYLMVGMPYFLLGAFGFVVYRGLKQKSLAEQRAPGTSSADEGGRPCSLQSPGDAL